MRRFVAIVTALGLLAAAPCFAQEQNVAGSFGLYSKGVSYYHAGNLHEAKMILERALELDVRNEDAQTYLDLVNAELRLRARGMLDTYQRGDELRRESEPPPHKKTIYKHEPAKEIKYNSYIDPPARHIWDLGVEFSRFKYVEPNVMQDKGLMYGLTGSYMHSKNNYKMGIEGRFSFGYLDYDSESTGSIDDIPNYVWEFRGLGGYDFYPTEITTLTPYIGIGYRFLHDDSGGKTSSTGHLGYDRESNYYYTPLGIETITVLENDWSVGFRLEYDHFWKGIQKSYLSSAVSAFGDLENDQNEGYGYRTSLRLEKKTDKLDYLLEFFLRYWDIEESETASITYAGVVWGFGYEPENNSTEYGLRFAGKF